jgi:PAS domain S-box-containing protein
VFLDRDMWEKIVLNLLSNALKFTFDGSIRVRLAPRDGAFELAVEDTGTGIPEPELPRVFDRFHRIEGARARTQEGTGIGLALTHELVRLHGGTITATSRVGEGSSFVVRIPTGSAHLPKDSIGTEPATAPAAIDAAPFVDEAERWTQAPLLPLGSASPAHSSASTERILIVDDNADMREYLCQLLGRWQVTSAADGTSALARARANPPDLIVTDVMMPGLDGFELLRELRRDPRTAAVPVMMLSARAGEEARVSGLDAGADDYVVKPFSARELVARVASLLNQSRARREADVQRRHLRALVMQAPTPIAVLRGPDHVVEIANELSCRIWGRTEGEVVNRRLLDVLPELRDQPLLALLDQVLRSGVPYVGKEMAVQFGQPGAGSPETHYFNFVFAPLRAPDGAIEGILAIAFDVTDEVTARNEVDRLRAAAEAANRTKDDFLAMLGHELRNPLAPIVTALELMNLRGDQTLARERTVIDRQVRHLARLVDDLLDMSRIAKGKIELRHQLLDVADIVAAAVEATSPLLDERQHRLEIQVPRGLTVRGDATRLVQVTMNVLTNAAKYTETGGSIAVHAASVDGHVELRVRDTGIGISVEMLPHVFEMFAQERQALDRAHGGLGLGLTIVKSLVELHGGTVHAFSEGVGRGSEFVIRLPAVSMAEPAPATSTTRFAPAAPAPSRRRVLVVDDNVDAARTMADALEAMGHATRIAHDGPSALYAAAEFKPDAALLDLGLPLMDGYEVARQLQASNPGRAPVLVAITGYGQASDHERTRAAGFRAHVVKPVDLEQLTALLSQLLAD